MHSFPNSAELGKVVFKFLSSSLLIDVLPLEK